MAFVFVVATLIIFLAFLVSALPLHLAVIAMNGKSNILKTIAVMILGSFFVSLIHAVVGIFAGLVAFLVLIWLYRVSFRLTWVNALMVWLLQFVFLAIFFMIGLMIVGTLGMLKIFVG